MEIFFIQNALKFPALIHSQKPDPVTSRQSGRQIFDFICNTPESMHMATLLFSPWRAQASVNGHAGHVGEAKAVEQAEEQSHEVESY